MRPTIAQTHILRLLAQGHVILINKCDPRFTLLDRTIQRRTIGRLRFWGWIDDDYNITLKGRVFL